MFERVIRFRTYRSCLIHSIRVEDGRVVSREFDVKVVRERNRKKKKKVGVAQVCRKYPRRFTFIIRRCATMHVKYVFA